MNVLHACLSLCLLQLSASAVAQDSEFLAPAMQAPERATVLEPGTVSVDSCLTQNYSFYPGCFVGLGGSFNSVKLDQSLSGTANTSVYNGSVLVATGSAGGPAPPFHGTLTTFAPVAQLGYFRNFASSDWLWGSKFSYKYLGLTFSDQNIDSPQSGSFTSTSNPPSTTPFTGNATADSVQTSVNHELALLPFLGRSFENGRFYVGGGPVVFDTQSRIYGLSSYADINGQHTNIGGAPLNLSSSAWMWGGAWQAGMVYYVRPSCFLDLSYDFMVTRAYTHTYPTPVTSESNGLTYVSMIYYNTVQRVLAQSFTISFNLTF